MNRRKPVQRALIGLGVLSIVALVLVNGGLAGQTMASWSDRVLGGSVFRTAEVEQTYARALSAQGRIQRALTGGTFGPVRSVTDTQGPFRFSDSGWTSSIDGGLLGLVAARAEGRSCSRSMNTAPNECVPAPSTGSPTPQAYATSQANRMSVSLIGGDLLSFFSYDRTQPIVATAGCRPGQNGTGSMTGGPFTLLGSQVSFPAPNSQVSRSTTTLVSRYTVTARSVQTYSENRATSQLWLEVANYTLLGVLGWRMNMLVAHAECGIGIDTPPEPDLQTSGVALQADTFAARLTEPADDQNSETCIEAAPDEGRADDAVAPDQPLPVDETSLSGEDVEAGPTSETDLAQHSEHTAHDLTLVATPCVDETPTALDVLAEEGVAPEEEVADSGDGQEPSTSARDTRTPQTTSTPTSPVKEASTDTTTDATTTEKSVEQTTPADSSTPDTPSASPTVTTTPASPADTAPAPVPAPGPTEPTHVGVGQPFALVATDGTELGTATVTAVRNDPGCGIAVQMSVRTSSKTNEPRWNTLTSNDFRAVLADGSTTAVGSASGGCDPTRTALPQVLEPASSYAGWITFGSSPVASAVMLRPAGTAGWMFTVPAAPPSEAVPAPTPTSPAVVPEESTTDDPPTTSSTSDVTPASPDSPDPEPEAE